MLLDTVHNLAQMSTETLVCTCPISTNEHWCYLQTADSRMK